MLRVFGTELLHNNKPRVAQKVFSTCGREFLAVSFHHNQFCVSNPKKRKYLFYHPPLFKAHIMQIKANNYLSNANGSTFVAKVYLIIVLIYLHICLNTIFFFRRLNVFVVVMLK